MEIEKTENLLRKFDYKFIREKDTLIIELDFSQRIIIDFSDSEKITIRDRLVGWNFLTGLVEMSIKRAMLYNFFGSLIIALLFVYLDVNYGEINLLFIFMLFIVWVILWTTFYLIKAESCKRILIGWNQ